MTEHSRPGTDSYWAARGKTVNLANKVGHWGVMHGAEGHIRVGLRGLFEVMLRASIID